MQRRYLSVELSTENAAKFSRYLKSAGVYYEASGAYNMTHFECLMDTQEAKNANAFLSALYE